MHFSEQSTTKVIKASQSLPPPKYNALIKLTSDNLIKIKQLRRFSRDFSKELFLVTNSLIVENSKYSELSYVCDPAWANEDEKIDS